MQTTLAILAALPREIASLVRGFKPHPAFQPRSIFVYEIPGAVVVAAGMGAHRATLALEAARAVAPITDVLSVGLAGGCRPELAPGSVAEASTIIDVRTGERFATAHGSSHTLATTDTIAGIAEKRRLSETYDAAMVDMEAATLARLAHAHGLRFRAIKAISDGHDFELPSLSLFADRNGHFRTGAFALHTALHPGDWGRASLLGRESGRALKALDTALRAAIRSHNESR